MTDVETPPVPIEVSSALIVPFSTTEAEATISADDNRDKEGKVTSVTWVHSQGWCDLIVSSLHAPTGNRGTDSQTLLFRCQSPIRNVGSDA